MNEHLKKIIYLLLDIHNLEESSKILVRNLKSGNMLNKYTYFREQGKTIVIFTNSLLSQLKCLLILTSNSTEF